MKTSLPNRLRCLMVLLVTCLCLASPRAWAYFKVDGGVNLVNDTDATISPGTLSFDTGVRAGVAGGLQVYGILAAELELDFQYNNLKNTSAFGSIDRAYLFQLPLFGNLVLRKEFGRFTPFIGGGAGVLMSDLYMEQTVDFGGGSTATFNDSDYDVLFAWHAFGGLSFRFGQAWHLNLTYRYQMSDGPTWHLDEGLTVNLERVVTQSLSLGLSYKF